MHPQRLFVATMARSKFYEKIKTATIERQVEDVYNQGISTYFKNVKITYPYQCDGFVDTHTEKGGNLRLLIEYKYDENFQSSAGQAKVLAQVIYYLKAFELNGQPLPNVILVGDINECFVLHANCLLSYLDEDLDWSIAASKAAENNPQLILKLSQDAAINPFVFVVNEDFSFQNVYLRILDQADNVQRFVRVTEHNIAGIYDYFLTRVVKNPDKLSANQLVDVFLGTITNQEDYYIHPRNPNKLVGKDLTIDIDPKAFQSFIGVFNREYTPTELHRFAEISDRLIEDTNRRRKGEFYTPTPFVDYAHKMLSEQLGEDWKEKYVVWDCCWGTGNLTRDYQFKELYASTLEQAELNIGEKYNHEATKFVFDFLNDPIEGDLYGKTGVPQGLRDALQQDKPILFFINPPYATASSDYGKGDENSKGQGTCRTRVNVEMTKNNLGCASNNLYAQFLYRIFLLKNHFNLTNIHIGLFSPTLFLTGGAWKIFRKSFLKAFAFSNAIQFKASYFADVSDNWGISFSIWEPGETEDKSSFIYTLIDLNNGEIEISGTKTLYNIDNESTAKDWIKENIKGVKVIDKPTMSSALNIKEGPNCRTKIANDALGCYSNMGNSVDQNQLKVSIFSSCDSSNANGLSILPANYYRVTSLFAARKLIEKNWINSKDEYLAPNEQHEQWNEFVADSIIYSLFHTSSNQSSLRRVEYKGKQWDIRNEFFFMGKEEIMQLAEQNKLYDTYEDARTDHERFVFLRLQETQLSPEAQAVLDKARELTIATMPYRNLFDQEHPEYQILNWDCGWYQIKAVVKQYMPKEYDAFSELYKRLADKMRPMVYTLGFLK